MFDATEGYAHNLGLEDRSRSNSDEVREIDQLEIDEAPAYYKRRSGGVWACLAALTVALGVAMLYGYAVLQQEGIQLEQIPGMANSFPAIGQRLASFERRLAVSKADQQNLASQMQVIDTSSKDAFIQARQQTRKAVDHAQKLLLNELNQQNAMFQAQLSQLVSERNADRLHLAQVQGQLAQVRYELDAARSDYARELAGVREQQGEEHRELTSISSSIPTRQLTFEAHKNQMVEVTSGVFFYLTKTEIGHQRFDGWIESAMGHQKVWVQSQGVGNPVLFLPSDDGKALVMVLTKVDEKGATGYLLIPAENSTTDQADIVSAQGNPVDPAKRPSGSNSNLVEP
jgi:hypothetical protein